jgi:uncharacterized repeat protein (TIGR01451 family)
VRSASEIATINKTVDVAVTASFDTLQARANDPIEITIIARNIGGPFTATDVAIVETIPASLTYVSSSATRGSYNPSTETWTIGNMAPGATADTLRIQTTVTGGPGGVPNTARLRPLRREVDTNPGNDVASLVPPLVIS